MYSVDDVTIIIPAYCPTEESVGWFEDCLESALKQKCPIVIVSDFSPKPVYHIVKDLWEPQVTFHELPEHKGVSFARNKAVSLATTDLIFPLDCDDLIVEGAIEQLLQVYDGTPLYVDLSKFGEEEVEHYNLLNFDCQHLYKKVGLASVNVLHQKAQWQKVGGWNEFIDLYEDGEYNSRLMLTYCGHRYPVPLIKYRIHNGQRTRINKAKSGPQVRKILAIIREYPDMCCGKNRRVESPASQSNSVIRSSQMKAANLPGMSGDRVLALYTGGKGRGKHYYRGPGTKFNYKVLYGEHYYVDPSDAKDEGVHVNSLFVRANRDVPSPSEVRVIPPVEEVKPPVKLEPRKAPVKTPVTTQDPPRFFNKEAEEALPDIVNLKWAKEIRHMEFTPDQAKKLIPIEEKGLGRVKVLAHLKKSL